MPTRSRATTSRPLMPMMFWATAASRGSTARRNRVRQGRKETVTIVRQVAKIETGTQEDRGTMRAAMRNKLLNEGKEVRGKKIVPIKSALNFIKATLFPLKINYQKENFSTVVDPELHPNTPVLHTALTEAIQQQYRPAFLDAFNETAKQIPELIREVIYTTPFRNDRLFCKKLYLSITLTLLNDITLPKKVRKKLMNSVQKLSSTSGVKHLISTYANNLEPAILWHIDNSFQNYVRILTIKVKKLISKKFNYAIHSDDLSDDLIDSIIQNVYENYDDKGDMG